MCEFISWKKVESEILFLTDKDVFSSHGRETLRDNKDNDILGHRAIETFYGQSAIGGANFEDTDFWKRGNYPPEIAKFLKSPQTLLNTWGRMLRRALQPDDACYILINAPPRWRKALSDICLDVVSKSAHYSCNTFCDVKGLTNKQKDILIEAVSKDANCSCYTLRDIKGLTDKQRSILEKAQR